MDFCNLSGKTILVTGASSGIGAATADRIARQGGKLVLTARDTDRLNDVFSKLSGNDHQQIICELTEEAELNQLVNELPKIDGLVHCAGIVGPTPAKFIRQEDIDRLTRINFEVPVLLTARCLLMKKIEDRASLVFLSTIATDYPYFGGALYNSAKAALESYAKTLALELVNRGIRSNSIAPGLVDTPMINQTSSDGQMELVDESLERYMKKYPMGVGEASDVAATIVFLLSNEAKWISGTHIKMGAVLK